MAFAAYLFSKRTLCLILCANNNKNLLKINPIFCVCVCVCHVKWMACMWSLHFSCACVCVCVYTVLSWSHFAPHLASHSIQSYLYLCVHFCRVLFCSSLAWMLNCWWFAATHTLISLCHLFAINANVFRYNFHVFFSTLNSFTSQPPSPFCSRSCLQFDVLGERRQKKVRLPLFRFR